MKLLRVDLTEGRLAVEESEPELAGRYLGGVGLALKLLADEVGPQTGAADRANRVIFAAGPLSGTPFPATATAVVATKSPLTGTLVESTLSGDWAQALGQSGYSAIVVAGASARPVYLDVDREGARLRDASGLWGLDPDAARETLAEDAPAARVLTIGVAGERRIPLAALVDDRGAAVGRGGVGAVLGAKGLKAIVLRGGRRAPVADGERLRDLTRRWSTAWARNSYLSLLTKFGTAAELDSGWSTGHVPVGNWRGAASGWKEGCLRLGGRAFVDAYDQPHESCPGCPVRCTRQADTGEAGRFAMSGPGPDYEALAALGALSRVDDLAGVCYASHLANRYGLDPVSTGAAIAFAFEAAERGLSAASDAGVALRWGSAEALVELVRQVGEGSRLGALLGKGVRAAADAVGREADGLAVHVGGLEPPPIEPRAYPSLAVHYATGPWAEGTLSHWFERSIAWPELGVNYRHGRFDPDGKGLLAKVGQDWLAALGSLGLCPRVAQAIPPYQVAQVATAATGVGWTAPELQTLGERVVNLRRAYNRSAVGGEDGLPPRLLEAHAVGPLAGRRIDLPRGLAEHYRLRGWTPAGEPSPETLERLGLG